MSNLELLLGLYESEVPAGVAWEDFLGPDAPALRTWQQMGFLGREPGCHPSPGCPYCHEGVPYLLGDRCLCNRCHSAVDRRHLLLWPLDLDAFLRWLAAELHLRGDVRRIARRFWQLGTHEDGDGLCECFYSQGSRLPEAARHKLMAYRSAVVLYGLSRPKDAEALPATLVSLLEVLGLAESLAITVRTLVPRRGGEVRFDPTSGRLDVGGTWQGEVQAGTREHAFLACLASRRGQFVSYGEIKREVLRRSGGRDSRDEASFCHRLKSRIKKKYIPSVDALVVTSNKADGYRLVARREP